MNRFRPKEFHLLLFPPVFWLGLFFGLPLLIVLVTSVSHQETYGGIRLGFTFEHYRRLTDSVTISITLRSLAYAAATTVLTGLVAFPMAYHMAFAPARVKTILMFLVILPFWTNFLVRMYAFLILLGGDGLVNGVLTRLGLLSDPLPLLHNPFAVLLGFVYGNLPFMILPLFAALDRMDVSLIEASMDLGAGRLRTFFRVTLPYALPGLAAGIVFVFIPTLGNFVVPEILGGPNDIILGNVINRQFLASRNWPFGAALASALTFVLMVLIAIYIRRFDPVNRKGMTV